jgi:hypothetical protein
MTDAERKKRNAATSLRYYHRNAAMCNAQCIARRRKDAKRLYRKFQAWVNEVKGARGCAVCGESRPPCLDFHHRDPASKTFMISKGWRRGRKRVEKEMEKCTLLCANCHRALHYNSAENEQRLTG